MFMDALSDLFRLFVFPGGFTLLFTGLVYEWVDRKLMALFQNRVGPRWFQPLADVLKLFAKEEIIPKGVNPYLFVGMPVVALAGSLTAALYVPLVGLIPSFSFPGDLIATLYLMSLLTLCMGLAGSNTLNRFSLVGATRTLTQLFSYEAPFLLTMLGPAIVSGSWQIGEIAETAAHNPWLVISQPIGFLVAVIGLMGKLELHPFDAPEADTEIVAGALTEYSGRGLAIFRLAKGSELVVGLTLVAAFYLGGIANPLVFLLKTLGLLFVIVILQSLLTRLRIDQTVGMWWRYGVLLILVQWGLIIWWHVLV